MTELRIRMCMGHSDPFVKADQIRVPVRGASTLEGLVPNSTIGEMAEFDVWYVFGVDQVVNRLQVQA